MNVTLKWVAIMPWPTIEDIHNSTHGGGGGDWTETLLAIFMLPIFLLAVVVVGKVKDWIVDAVIRVVRWR